MSLLLSEITRIRNILTLRYDPEEASALPHKTWMDWNPTESDPEGIETESRLRVIIIENLSHYDQIGIALSSGVDSSLLLALIRQEFPKKKILALHYTGANNDELEASRKLANKFNAGFYEIHPVPVFDRIPFMIEMLDAPKWDAYDYVISRIARLEECDVLVTGDGADELYAGYTFRYEQFERFTGGRDHWHVLDEEISAYLGCHKNDFVEDHEQLFPNNEDFTNFNFLRDIHPYFYESFQNPLTWFNKMILADYNGKLLHNFLIKKNAFQKTIGIPIFGPMLEPAIRDFAPHISLREKYYHGTGKIPLRAICKRLGLNPPFKKLGFTHDIKSEFQKYYSDYLSPIKKQDALIYKYGIINPEWLKKHEGEQLEERQINKIVSLYTLEKYLQWKQ